MPLPTVRTLREPARGAVRVVAGEGGERGVGDALDANRGLDRAGLERPCLRGLFERKVDPGAQRQPLGAPASDGALENAADPLGELHDGVVADDDVLGEIPGPGRCCVAEDESRAARSRHPSKGHCLVPPGSGSASMPEPGRR